MSGTEIVEIFDIEATLLDATLRKNGRLGPLFTLDFQGVDIAALKQAYIQLLKMTADYVQYTVPALNAAGHALRGGDAEDRRWSELFLDYSSGETDVDGDYGHHIWAHDDIIALDALSDSLKMPAHPAAVRYGEYFVDRVAEHPYAILGAKGVLEHLSIILADDVVRGLLESGIPGADKATKFFSEHGTLDIDHVREGDANIRKIESSEKCFQVIQGAYFTSGSYRSLIHYCLT